MIHSSSSNSSSSQVVRPEGGCQRWERGALQAGNTCITLCQCSRESSVGSCGSLPMAVGYSSSSAPNKAMARAASGNHWSQQMATPMAAYLSVWVCVCVGWVANVVSHAGTLVGCCLLLYLVWKTLNPVSPCVRVKRRPRRVQVRVMLS